LIRLARRILERAGAVAGEAESVARILVWGDASELPNQGLWRLDTTVRRLQEGGIISPCEPTIETLGPGCIRIDGHNGLGHYLAELAMDKAIALAATEGIAFVGIRNSNFCGALGYYVSRAAQRNCVAFAFSNSFPKVVPAGGTKVALGTNPIAVGAPGADGTDFVLDMSTSASAGSTITRLLEKGEKIPAGVAIGADGEPALDEQQALQGGLLPFGGGKGFGLAVVVEIVAGVLPNAGISREVMSMYHYDTPGRNGQCFIVLDVERFMPRSLYDARFSALRDFVVNDRGVRLPGDRRTQALNDSERLGVYLEMSTQHKLIELANTLNVRHPF
jgi:LDH2 family malate/lactate/ureidoglycolate dehydrogenase